MIKAIPYIQKSHLENGINFSLLLHLSTISLYHRSRLDTVQRFNSMTSVLAEHGADNWKLKLPFYKAICYIRLCCRNDRKMKAK